MSDRNVLVVGVAPLWELEYTGIANVVYELANRFINQSFDFDVKFSVFNRLVDSEIIKSCIDNRSGQRLREAFHQNVGVSDLIVDADGKLNGQDSYGLYLHIKPGARVFKRDSILFYDFSFLLTQECHTRDTFEFHTNELVAQIDSSDLFFCISEATATDLKWLFDVEDEKVVVSLLGSNVDDGDLEKVDNIFKDKEIEKFILVLGTIEPRKNIDIVLKWASQNQSVFDEYKFVFVGRQGWGGGFEKYISAYNLKKYLDNGRIAHLGYVSELTKLALLKGATLTVYPSLFEGFGLPVLEAMHAGSPVLATCSTSVPEVLGENGYYFDPYDISSFDRAFKEFEKDCLSGHVEEIKAGGMRRALEMNYDETFKVILNSIREKLFVNK